MRRKRRPVLEYSNIRGAPAVGLVGLEVSDGASNPLLIRCSASGSIVNYLQWDALFS